jgi:serine/threonine protein kinase
MLHMLPLSESAEDLVERIKEELRAGFAHGERPAARDYLERLPLLREDHSVALSLIYEEFCLLEEAGECLEPEDFCRRYPRWKDSLELQLKIHRDFSAAAACAPSPPRLLEPGEWFDGFRIDSILGRGGTSQVYLAREDAMGGRAVALKVTPDRGPEPGIMGGLDHPRIMPAFSACRVPDRGLRGLCMPYRPGAPLDALARRSQPLKDSHGAAAFRSILDLRPAPGAAPPPWLDGPGWHGYPANGSYEDAVAWIVMAVAEAISHIHSCGVIHRDIKPSNVYVAARDGPLLFDFGFARSLGIGEALPGGTPAYMAPEHLRAFLDPRGWDEIGPAADIYALGLTLLELLLGKPPEVPSGSPSGPRMARMLLEQRASPCWPARITAVGLPPAMAEIVRRCLAPAPAERYADAGDVARELGRLLASTAAGPSAHARAVRQTGRLRGSWASAGTARRARRARPGPR